jgi:hypothetical protein
MDSPQLGAAGTSPDAIAFVRFCYGRRPVPWPELYDEMSAVASRGLVRGWSYPELAEHGIGFALPDLPRLAALVSTITRADAQASVLVDSSGFRGEDSEVLRAAAVPASVRQLPTTRARRRFSAGS